MTALAGTQTGEETIEDMKKIEAVPALFSAGAPTGYTRDILECNLPPEVLAALLKDRATGKNIFWATDDYTARGPGFSRHDEITLEAVLNRADPVIRPRVDKPKDVQKSRASGRAEVFTPSWVCNIQNNCVDAAWFGWKKPNSSPFNNETRTAPPGKRASCAFESASRENWKVSLRPIRFPKGKSWRDYVKAPRLEISCGEAPYLASRYDAVSGAMIHVPDRIGLLDRKLRVVSENAEDRQDWLHYAKRAVQSCYGFEWQGDNVLLARENLLATVAEHYNWIACGEASTSLAHLDFSFLLEIAEIKSKIDEFANAKRPTPSVYNLAITSEF